MARLAARASRSVADPQVFNQAPPLEDVDVFSSNLPLVEALEREGARMGARARRGARTARRRRAAAALGAEANENKPVLHTHDRYGNRIDEVEFHPAWHELMRIGVEHELHSLPWTSAEPGAHVARAALYMTAIQAEAGFACPITMTYAVMPALRASRSWRPSGSRC